MAPHSHSTNGPKVTVVMPTYNRWHEARVSLANLLASDYARFDVVLVEDGCSDGTPEKCRAEFPGVEILRGDGNLWWSGAINLGTRHALERGADLVMWVNDDNRVEPGTLGALVACHLRHGPTAVACSRVRAGDDGEWAGDPPPWHREAAAWRRPEAPPGEDVEIAHPPGGQGVLVPAGCFRDAGLVDARAFPHYWADHDFHYRAMKAGYRYFVAAGAVVRNVPNKPRPQAANIFSLRGGLWFLSDRRSAMNMTTLRRLLKRHLPPREYRATFYPLLRRHLLWLAYGWLSGRPGLHRAVRLARRGATSGRRAPGG